MSFETMSEAIQTLSTYSRSLCDMYRREQEASSDAEAKAALGLALKYEEKLAHQIDSEMGELGGKLRHANFKWHDKTLLLELPKRLERPSLQGLQDVIAEVTECGKAAIGYCEALTGSTNSTEVLEFIESLKHQREQYLKDFVRQAGRGMQ